MERKEICKALIEKAVKARVCCFNGKLGWEGKMKAPLCNSFLHGICYASLAADVLTDEEIQRIENKADKKIMDEDDISFVQSDMILLPPDDKISTCSYSYHLKRYILVRLVSLLCGALIGYFLLHSFL